MLTSFGNASPNVECYVLSSPVIDLPDCEIFETFRRSCLVVYLYCVRSTSTFIFSILQAIYRWLSRDESGVEGPKNLFQRKEIIRGLRNLRHQTTVSSFKVLKTNRPHFIKQSQLIAAGAAGDP